MRLTIEFEPEWWQIKAWWHRKLCDWFGHPGFEERKPPTGYAMFSMFHRDERPRCTRCNAPDPKLPKPEQSHITYVFGEGETGT